VEGEAQTSSLRFSAGHFLALYQGHALFPRFGLAEIEAHESSIHGDIQPLVVGVRHQIDADIGLSCLSAFASRDVTCFALLRVLEWPLRFFLGSSVRPHHLEDLAGGLIVVTNRFDVLSLAAEKNLETALPQFLLIVAQRFQNLDVFGQLLVVGQQLSLHRGTLVGLHLGFASIPFELPQSQLQLSEIGFG